MIEAISTTSITTTVSVRISVPNGSPTFSARCSACRTTPNAATMIAPRIRTKQTAATVDVRRVGHVLVADGEEHDRRDPRDRERHDGRPRQQTPPARPDPRPGTRRPDTPALGHGATPIRVTARLLPTRRAGHLSPVNQTPPRSARNASPAPGWRSLHGFHRLGESMMGFSRRLATRVPRRERRANRIGHREARATGRLSTPPG